MPADHYQIQCRASVTGQRECRRKAQYDKLYVRDRRKAREGLLSSGSRLIEFRRRLPLCDGTEEPRQDPLS